MHVSLSLLIVKQRYFEFGDKPQRLLVRQLRGFQANRAIHQIKSPSGVLITDPIAINDCFREYYEKLYQTKAKGDVKTWLKNFKLPKLDEAAQRALDSELTSEEIIDSIKSFPSTKNYKITPLLLRMFIHSTKLGTLPKTLYAAHISLLLKPGRDKTDLSSYRPIALLNTDLKILSTVLANRLKQYITSIIHPDQTGFIPNRFSFFNVRRLMDIIYHKYHGVSAQGVLSLDAEKAFDQVEWGYIIATLKEFGFGHAFISWVQMLFEQSPYFSLYRGTCQGCPLSPLLFSIAIEPLAISIREDENIKPIILGGVEHKLPLYADDIILLSEPEQSIPHLLKLIGLFSEKSGYTINWQKSEFMALSANHNPRFLRSLPFKISTVKIKYLGIEVTKNPNVLFKHNFAEKMNRLKQDIDRGRILPLSLIGWVNAIKMVSLPRFFYPFQNIPIFIPKSFFESLDSIMPFIWGFKTHRISKIHKPRSLGGLGLPCFLHYYWVANARALAYWQYGYKEGISLDLPPWLAVEKDLIVDSSLLALFSSPRAPSALKKLGKLAIFQNLSYLPQFGTIIHSHPLYLIVHFVTGLKKAL
uniref:Reverse transcriptase domain-containing protein n=1 Tax=Pygocentrus nattereri TaxID=42514 RepID=A0AAR2J8F3_PYGNA